jgi:hypothetical protein
MMARAIATICFCPPDSASRLVPETLQRREDTKDPVQPRRIGLAAAASQLQMLLHGELGEDAHVLGYVGNALPRNLGRLHAGQFAAVKLHATGRSTPQPHDGTQRGALAGAITAQQHGQFAARHYQIHSMQNMVLLDMGVYPAQLQ